MSNLFEALTRGQESFADLGLESLWPKEPAGGQKGAVAPPELAREQKLNAAVAAPVPVPAREQQYKIEPAPAEDDLWANVRTLKLQVRQSAPILPFDGSHWRAGEQYRILRTRIVQHPKHPRMLVVTSAGPNDGKTVTGINLAGVLALKTGARVLLLDGDFRRSRVCAELGLPTTPGLANVLKGDCSLREAMIQAEQIPNLYIVPAGETQVNPAELFDSSAWTSLCATCRTHFAHIVVDSPPVGAVADYDLLQAAVDGVIVVTRPDHTNRQLCLKVLQTIPPEKMIGVIVNCLKEWLLDKTDNHYKAYYKT